MSSAPSETTCGIPSSPAASSRSGPAENTPPTSSSASSVVVTSSDAGDEAVLDERLHRLPAGAGRVEDEHLVAELLEPLAGRGHAGRRDAEHRRPDQRLRRRPSRRTAASPCPAIGGRRRSPGSAGDLVDAGDVDDGVHHRHVDRADVGPGVARGDGRDHQLRHADRQRAHRLRRRPPSRPSRRARGSPSSRPSAWSREHDSARAARHRLDRGPAVARGDQRATSAPAARATSSRVTSAASAGSPRTPASTRIDVHAVLAQPVAQVGVLVALRVERADQDDGRHDGLVDRVLPRG